jgi:hypothetical protein
LFGEAGLGFNEQIFGADEQVSEHGQSDKESVRLYSLSSVGAEREEGQEKGPFVPIRSELPHCQRLGLVQIIE